MAVIQVLDKHTIDKIAAGEVVERPLSVAKELIENAVDANSTAVTIEIKEGGIGFLRVTDNGSGISREQIGTAFLRHATSKIKSAEDLHDIHSLGFRGEALSSIAAVSQVEVITKTRQELTGTRYVIEGGAERSVEEVGAPDGTTVIVRNLFFNTPARKKFLKTAQTEGNYITALMEHMALSHPEVSFKLIVNGQIKLHSPGNNNLKDLIYHIYGREFIHDILDVECANEFLKITGYIGKPLISRGNRNYENFFVNGRYVKSSLLSSAVEEAYTGFVMQHKYPFVILHLEIDTGLVDVNVHPTKMELRFSNQEAIYHFVREKIREVLTHRELIPKASLSPKQDEKTEKPAVIAEKIPEPFEKKRLEHMRSVVRETSPYERKYPHNSAEQLKRVNEVVEAHIDMQKHEPVHKPEGIHKPEQAGHPEDALKTEMPAKAEQLTMFEEGLLSEQNRDRINVIGQVFDTYWLVEFQDSLYIIDQHAAHERILYEKTMTRLKSNEMSSQRVTPPVVISLNAMEEENLNTYGTQLKQLGFEIEHFGGKEYALNAVPYNMLNIRGEKLFVELLDEMEQMPARQTPEVVLERVAMMSCKAAVKGNQRMNPAEMEAILDELLHLENPYHCPHGRPTIIKITKQEMERKFKRIL